ncbi:hypothetical protein VAPA_1c44350 [Variovorax paradoxus B4]|uniref:Uncharacterized protein n=1 Tax=Variovorax paradoxus B4 TaxID=1246301 RepID=T1XG30_VARPD|nr:hypothetical protein VAPA_1c44350 [Variovorax paradoxus B4]
MKTIKFGNLQQCVPAATSRSYAYFGHHFYNPISSISFSHWWSMIQL